MNFADTAHSMKVALVLFVVLGAVVLAEAFFTPTPTPKPTPTERPTPPPCPDSCPPSPRYVCASDRRGNVYRFLNDCYMQKCACKMWLQPVSECSRDAPGCPVKDASDDSDSYPSSSSDSSSSASDDSDGHGDRNPLVYVQEDTESIKRQAQHAH